MELNDKHYDTIVKCIQDFYRWSHKFETKDSHIFIRVINALEIPMDEIKKIMEYKNE